jgi:hypothetical protein
MRGLFTAGRGVRPGGGRRSSNVGRHRLIAPVVQGVSRVSSTLPSHPGQAGNGTRLFIRPWLFLLDRGGEGPAPAGQFPGDGYVRDDPAFVPGLELLPLAVQPVVALMAADPGRFIRDVPAGTHLLADVGVRPAVVPGGLDQQRRAWVLPVLVIPSWDREAPEECSDGTRPRYAPMVLPVKRFQSPISTARPTAVSTEMPRRHVRARTTGAARCGGRRSRHGRRNAPVHGAAKASRRGAWPASDHPERPHVHARGPGPPHPTGPGPAS